MKSNRIATLSLLALALLVSVPSTFAQTHVKANADVPFAFKVGNSALPAGSYTVSSIASSAISIASRESHADVITLVRTEYASKDQSPKLVFHKCGDQYFLAQIWDGSGKAGLQLPQSNLEKELQKETLASNQGAGAEEYVVIALN